MKYLSIICASLLALGMSFCAGKDSASDSKGKKFEPKERMSSMTDEQRQAAIAAKKESLQVDIPSLMHSNGVKLTVLPPEPTGDITPAISAQIGAKMLQIIAVNGIGGVNNVPDFALGATLSETGREVTATAPQKYIVKYDVNFKVLNMADGTVYSSASESITGVGSSFVEATRNAVNEVKSTSALQSMLSTAESRIIEWYDNNLRTVKNQVAAAVSANNYALAMAYLNSVPSQAAEAYAYASNEYPKVLDDYKKTIAASELAALKGEIAKGAQSAEINPDVYTHLALLPADSPQYQEAEKLVENYQTSVLSRQANEKEKASSASESERIHKEQMEMAKLQADKEIALVQAKASQQALTRSIKEMKDDVRGFWGNLGARIISSMDYAGGKVSKGLGDEE